MHSRLEPRIDYTMASRIQLVLFIDQGNLGGRRELASAYAAYIYAASVLREPDFICILANQELQ